MFSSPKTTIAGIVAVLTGLGLLGAAINAFMNGEPVNYEEFASAIGSIIVGLGLIAGRDNTTSSEDVSAHMSEGIDADGEGE